MVIDRPSLAVVHRARSGQAAHTGPKVTVRWRPWGGGMVTSLSCASEGNCTAGGDYADSDGHEQGFVVSERSGVWGAASGVPGLAALDKTTEVRSVSCGSAGSCAAAGCYVGHHGNGLGFVVTERNGVWGTAIKVPGQRPLNLIFVATENNGVWRKAPRYAAWPD